MGRYYPLVSVIVPNYNHARYLDQRIQSILDQTYKNIEVIILDDCSTDNSLEIIERYRSDPRIVKVEVNEINCGIPFLQWKKGINMAKGELIWIAESDDYCDLSLLSELVSAYQKKPDTLLAYSTSIWRDSVGNATWTPNNSHNDYLRGKRFLSHYLLFACFLYNASSAIFRKSAALKVSDRYTTISSAGDYLFWVEIASQGDVAIVNKGLNSFRRHNSAASLGGYSSGENMKNEKEIFDLIKKKVWVSAIRERLARLYRIQAINNSAEYDRSTKQQLIQLWGSGTITVMDRIALNIMFHLRARFNYYL